MGMLQEFKAFAIKGNLTDTAIAFVMGAAFGKIVSAFVDGMVMPLVGQLTGGVDFSEKKWVLQPAVAEIKNGSTIVQAAVAEVSVKYGVFITSIIDFLIVALAVFMVVKSINNLKKKEAAIPAPPPPIALTDELLTEIRDLLKNK